MAQQIPDSIIDGDQIEEGDILIGISSSGIHSNGLTLARNIFCNKENFLLNRYFDELGHSMGEELLKPAYIYVDEIMEMIRAGVRLKTVAHITSDGLVNLTRIGKNFGYEITDLPKPQPIYELIRSYGHIDTTEMYNVYNMGIGMCAVLPREQCDSALQIAEKYRKKAFVMGKALNDHSKKIEIKPLRIVSINEEKFAASSPPSYIQPGEKRKENQEYSHYAMITAGFEVITSFADILSSPLSSLIAFKRSMVVTIPITLPSLSIIGTPLNAPKTILVAISMAVAFSFAATMFTDITS
ncbi:MAG: hypothetical protein JO297_10760 [Nitrososphaeraceae archaeon]|nr:hypothetical protein [Nitrososphaeraceae archaeon]